MEMAFVKIIHPEKISQFFMELCNKFHGFIETAETRFWKVRNYISSEKIYHQVYQKYLIELSLQILVKNLP